MAHMQGCFKDWGLKCGALRSFVMATCDHMLRLTRESLGPRFSAD